LYGFSSSPPNPWSESSYRRVMPDGVAITLGTLLLVGLSRTSLDSSVFLHFWLFSSMLKIDGGCRTRQKGRMSFVSQWLISRHQRKWQYSADLYGMRIRISRRKCTRWRN